MVNLRTSTRITAQLVGATGIDVTRENGIYTVSLDLGEFVDLPSVDSEDEENTYLPFVQIIGDDAFYGKMSFANFAAQIGATLTSLYQPVDATLTALAGVTTAANKLIYATGADAFTTTDLTAAGRAILDDADATAQRVTLGLVIGTDVQAFDAELSALAGLTSAADKLPYFTGAGTAGVTDFSAFARTILDDANAAAVRTTIGAGIGDLVSTNNLSDVANAATAFGNIKQAASETATGVVELATNAETITGTDTARAITPANLAAAHAWQDWTPTITASAGTITTVTATGRYCQIGKVVHTLMKITITTNGTGSGILRSTLPVNGTTTTPGAWPGLQQSAGAAVYGRITGASQLSMLATGGTYPASDGEVIHMSGTYEAA